MLVSYAQNFEDVILWRALKSIKTGFYIDLGANDPEQDSVSLAFYEMGWRGVHVEPFHEFAEKLRSARPDEEIIEAAIGELEGDLTFYKVGDTGMSTGDAAIAAQHAALGYKLEIQTVPCLRLSTILSRFDDKDVHWLKIDVEGMERSVIRSWSPSKARPWIVVVESTKPNSPEPNHQEWEPDLLMLGYEFVYFDGLNRFYLSVAHPELKSAFGPGPHFFDDFALSMHTKPMRLARSKLTALESTLQIRESDSANLRADLNAAVERARNLQREIDVANSELAASNRQAAELRAELSSARHRIDALLASTSWRVTSPLRNSKRFYHLVNHGIFAWLTFAPGTRPRRIARRLVTELAQLVSRYPSAKNFARRLLARSPRLKARLTLAVHNYRSLQLRSGARLRTAEIDGATVDRPQHVDLAETEAANVIYLFVGHTVKCDTNTGVQRTVRGLASGLRDVEAHVRFVKWDTEAQECVFITYEERAYLSQWNGPPIGKDEYELYAATGASSKNASVALHRAGSWMLVPEVTHTAFHQNVATLDLIVWARAHALKIGFIFYDAIPLLRPEFSAMAGPHSEYMRHLRLADIVWPISEWSARDLQSFWRTSERADSQTMPVVVPHHLPAGISRDVELLETKTAENLILAVGTIEERKNQVALIRAFEAYKASHPESSWKLVLAGNLHPNVADEVLQACKRNHAINYTGHVSDATLNELYLSCSFTVFASVEEGFGLPILESLAYGKPCICANFGAMAELIEGGGCLPVDTRDVSSLQRALEELIGNDDFRASLAQQARSRKLTNWTDYANNIIRLIDPAAQVKANLGIIYYWVEFSAQWPNQTSIQCVTRQLARELHSLGLSLIPVKWNTSKGGLEPVSSFELSCLANWGAPEPHQWAEWIDPGAAPNNSWLLIPELPLHLTHEQHRKVVEGCKGVNLKLAGIFYGASPNALGIPSRFADSRLAYLTALGEYDLVFATTDVSRRELMHSLGQRLRKPQSLEFQIKALRPPLDEGSWRGYSRRIATELSELSDSIRDRQPSLSEDEVRGRSLAMNIASRPRLSLCISTYNRAEWLSVNLKNWARLYPVPLSDVEVLICDNASTDHTADVVQPYLSRPDVTYVRNVTNVGMLGNLRVTANHARGDYIWIVGDDDLLIPGSLENILKAIEGSPGTSLVYLNYAFTRLADAREIEKFDLFFSDATPIVPAEPDREGLIKEICSSNENFFTAIYTLVFRRDHAINAYSQNTAGRPFATMLTAIPTTYYVLNHMMDESGVWIGSPQIVVNMNVSWMKYAPLWILERIPEVYELAERKGVPPADIDRWRRHTLQNIPHYFAEIYRNDPLNNAAFFSPERLVRRFQHLPEFVRQRDELISIYEQAFREGHPAAQVPSSEVFRSLNGHAGWDLTNRQEDLVSSH